MYCRYKHCSGGFGDLLLEKDGVWPQSYMKQQCLINHQISLAMVDVAWLTHSPSLTCQKLLHEEKNLIVEMEAETSLHFQSNELGPHPVAN